MARHRAAAAVDDRRLDDLLAQAAGLPPTRPFEDSLGGPELSVIAEIKRRSPSKGDLAPGLDPAELAKAYEAGGAACLSVLTDDESFGGSVEDLVAARAAVSLPVLRKDFTVDARDVVDARLMGADAVLLIAAALDDAELSSFFDLAHSLGLAALVEVHDMAELDRALAVGATLVGVNARDLRTFEVDLERVLDLAGHIPDGVLAVAESGIRGHLDALRVASSGYAAVLVGELLVTSGDPEAALTALRG